MAAKTHRARPDAKTLSVNEAAAEVGVSRATLYRLMADGTLTWIGGTKRRIPRKSLEAWQAAHTVRGRF